MSHKLITYFDAPIPSWPGRSGARSVGEGAASVPVACGRPTGVWSAYLLPIYRHLRRHVLRFTAVYANLFYTKLLILLELLSLDPWFGVNCHLFLQCGRRPAVAPARHRQGGGRPRAARLEAFYYTTNIRLSAILLSHKWITYLEALIPSCPARRGSGCSGGSQGPAGVFSSLFIRIYVPIVRNGLRFTAVYAHLFETKSLNSLVLREFALFFRGCGSAAVALPHGIDEAHGRRGTRELMFLLCHQYMTHVTGVPSWKFVWNQTHPRVTEPPELPVPHPAVGGQGGGYPARRPPARGGLKPPTDPGPQLPSRATTWMGKKTHAPASHGGGSTGVAYY